MVTVPQYKDSLSVNREVISESGDDLRDKSEICMFNCRGGKSFSKEGMDPADVGSQLFCFVLLLYLPPYQGEFAQMINDLFYITMPPDMIQSTCLLGIVVNITFL